jgi:chemotaxis protein MotA
MQAIDAKEDPLLKKGLRYVIDGTDSEALRELLENDVAIFEKHRKHEAEIFTAAGGYSPTMGIIGTVLGLIIVLSNLAEPDKLGSHIAVAFIATLIGIAMANLFWLPIGNKLKGQVKKFRLEKQLVIVGVRSIQQGESPALVREKIEGFLEESEKKELDANRTE